jgi:glycerol-3-phosphate acyltransferase PlsX
VLALASRYPTIQFQLYGESTIKRELSYQARPKNITVVITEESVSMDDSPIYALRRKRHSSMAKSLQAVADHQADGCISAGNTGALGAMGLHLLKTHEGIDRPALCQALPTAGKVSYMLDLGGNVDCSAKQLSQFASLGVALCHVLNRNPMPSVKLLNIGHEPLKGSTVIQEAAIQLQDNPKINYQGFIEGDEIYHGRVDVIVTDGFVGNIALKVSEGVARFVMRRFKDTLNSNIFMRLMALFSRSGLRRWEGEMNPDQYNGAYLLGLKGTVVKSHGDATQQQFAHAIEMLIQKLQKQSRCSMEDALRAIMA